MARCAVEEIGIITEIRRLFLDTGARVPLHSRRDSHGHEVDLFVDLGALKGLLAYGGGSSYRWRAHHMRPWFACS